jgi:hypothetical protein
MANYSNPSPDKHLEVLYRQTYNSIGSADATSLTQNNTVGNAQKLANSRLIALTPSLGVLAGSVVAVTGASTIGPCVGDSSTAHDTAVGIAVNDAVGNPYESSSAVASGKIVYAHGTGTVLRTCIYEQVSAGSATYTYLPGQVVYASQNGLLSPLDGTATRNMGTPIGIVLDPPSAANSYYMTIQLKI